MRIIKEKNTKLISDSKNDQVEKFQTVQKNFLGSENFKVKSGEVEEEEENVCIFYNIRKKRINRSFPMCPERYKLTQNAVFSADYSPY